MFRLLCYEEGTVGNVQTFEHGDDGDEIRVHLSVIQTLTELG